MLEGVRVVELATYVAAPGAAGIMADWGAEVIKVEPLGGDPFRGFLRNISGADVEGNPVFDVDNRGKKGITVNLATAEGAAIMHRLLETADVFLTNIRPKALERAGLSYEQIATDNPRLIYATVTGYGLKGADRNRPGFDMAAFWSRGGVAAMTVPRDHEPYPIRTAAGDHATAMAMLGGIMGALFARERTGRGRFVEASLLRTGIYFLAADMAVQLRYGRVASTRPRHQAVNPLNSFYRSADGTWICLLTRHGGDDWKRILEVIERSDLADDPRFNTVKARRANVAELVELLDAAFAKRPLAEWAERLDAADFVWAPVQRPEQVMADPQAEAAGAFVEIERPDGNGTHRSIASPIRFDGEDLGTRPPAPEPGQHTDEVLRVLGYDDAAIADLRRTGAVG